MCMIFIILKLRVKLNGKVDDRINLTVLCFQTTLWTPHWLSTFGWEQPVPRHKNTHLTLYSCSHKASLVQNIQTQSRSHSRNDAERATVNVSSVHNNSSLLLSQKVTLSLAFLFSGNSQKLLHFRVGALDSLKYAKRYRCGQYLRDLQVGSASLGPAWAAGLTALAPDRAQGEQGFSSARTTPAPGTTTLLRWGKLELEMDQPTRSEPWLGHRIEWQKKKGDERKE